MWHPWWGTIVQTPLYKLASAVEVFPVLGEEIQGQEGVAIAAHLLAEPIAFAQQASLPDHVTLHGVLQVLLSEHLVGLHQHMDDPRVPVAPVDQSVRFVA